MKKINSIKFIDSLAEITSHRDQELIERSLLKTLIELKSDSTFQLYQVLNIEPALKLGLLAYATNNNIIANEKINNYPLSQRMEVALKEVIEQEHIITIESEKNPKKMQVIYPAFDANNDIFAILIQTTQHPDYEGQRLVHGFLRIYSNYLEMIEVTKRDKLTGLLNRETLDSEITRILVNNNIPTLTDTVMPTENTTGSRQYKGALEYWLCVVDIDHFKAINDQYGHIYGDEILILVARLLENNIRDFDKIFRFGGEEFVILLRSDSEEDAFLALERIRGVIATHQYAKIASLTISIGMAKVTHQIAPRNVIDEADSALYYAKENGRNQVHLYEQLIRENKITEKETYFGESDIELF